ncbi:MAG: EamA family transporter [Oceanospirillaceae bacterium]|nr:EamA family transporter [Oceanospirillaceae bacterium]
MHHPVPDPQPAGHSVKADLLLVGVTLLAALGWLFSKQALNEFPPLLFLGSRFLLAGLILVIPGHRALFRLTLSQWRVSATVGLVFGAAMSFWILGLFHAHSLAEGAFITSLAVVLVPLLSLILFREAPPRVFWIALPLAVAGLALLSLQHGFSPDPGQLLFLAAALLLSLTFILNGRAAARIPALALSAVQLLVVGLLCLSLSAFSEDWPQAFTPTMWLWLGLSLTLGTAVRFLLQTYAQGLTSPSHAAVIMILEPVWTTLLAFLWFGEHLSLPQMAGCSLIFSALLVNRWQAVYRLFVRRPSDG